jgi:cytochrome c-type biogenesis protein CcmH
VVSCFLVFALASAALEAQEGSAKLDTDAAPDAAVVVGSPAGPPLTGEALEARTDEVAGLLRCPVCQGLSVGDSPAGMAVKMKRQVKDLVAAGYDEEQILAYFERSYGEFVRLEPPMRGVNWLVWLAPLLGLAAGALVVGWALRAPRAPASPQGEVLPDPDEAEEDVPGPDSLPEEPRLAEYVLKVREEAYGWPGGSSPTKERGSR